jgi:hypothetical protein
MIIQDFARDGDFPLPCLSLVIFVPIGTWQVEVLFDEILRTLGPGPDDSISLTKSVQDVFAHSSYRPGRRSRPFFGHVWGTPVY